MPLIVEATASGVDLKTGIGGRLLPGGGLGTVLGRAVTAVEQRALWVAVLTVNDAVNAPEA